jgi:hypothetical protein
MIEVQLFNLELKDKDIAGVLRQDHRFEEINIIRSVRKSKVGILVRNSKLAML